MNAPPSKRAQEIFADALERTDAYRDGYVAAACGEDSGLRAEVAGLLGAHVLAGDTFLEASPPLPIELAEQSEDQTAADAPELIPSRIGRYAVLRRVGAGGMGAVYEAIQERPHRTVALKVMRQGLASRTAMRRFEMEAEVLGRLRHPAIAQVYEAGQFDDGVGPVPFFAMEFVPGARPITAYCRQEALSVRERLLLFAAVCDAVHHGHTRGIIHRDIKPSNILVDAGGKPKVIDFGVARATDADLAVTTMATQSSGLVGTLQYMSPEQAGATESDRLDSRSDVYSLGVVLYELVCGRLPYDLSACPLAEAPHLIREASPPSPGTIDRTLRGDLSTIILRALQKDPQRRYQSAAELKADLERFLAGQPIAARRDSIVYIARTRLRTWAGNHPVASSLLAVVLSWLLATGAAFQVGSWTGTSLLMERWAGTGGQATVPPSLNGVRLVSVTDESIETIARRDGVDPESLVAPGGLRPTYGKLMKRLAEAGPRAVVFDLGFRKSQPGDAEFVEGVDRLTRAGIAVVASTPGGAWSSDEATLAEYSALIRPKVRLGGATVMPASPTFITVDIAMAHSGSDVVPSVALAAVAAANHPEATPAYSLLSEQTSVEVSYMLRPTPVTGVAQRSPDVTRLKVSTISPEPDDDPEAGIRRGDLAAQLIVGIPPLEPMKAMMIPLEDALAQPVERLRDAVQRRIVLVGDRSAKQTDFLDTGRTIHGSLANAITIAALEGVGRIRIGSERNYDLSALCAAGLGVVLPFVVAPVLWRRAVATVLGVALCAGSCMAIYRLSGEILYPSHPSLAFVAAFILAVLIERARRARLV